MEMKMDTFEATQLNVYNKITKCFSNYKKTPKVRLTKSYLLARLESLEQDWISFKDTHKNIIRDIAPDIYNKSAYFTTDLLESVEELYIEFKSEINEQLENFVDVCKSKDLLSESKSVTKVDRSCVKLPKIVIPTFSGKYTEWTTFHDLFNSLIHKNSTLDNVQKLHYLKSHLSGEADQLLRHIPITSDNYLSCWEQLINRYSNKRYISNCILQRFMNLRPIHIECSGALKEFLDTTNETLHGLENLGIKTENWDIIIIYILSNKLDSESRKQWEAKISDSNDLSTLVQFKQFLEHRFRALEFLDNKSAKNMYRNNNNFNQSIPKNSFHVNVTPCIYCTDSHKLANCKKFAKEDCQTRRSFVETNSLCFNCLGSNHLAPLCRSPIRCRICTKRHHSLLHLKYSPPTNYVQVPDGNVVATTSVQDQPSTSDTLVTTCFAKTATQVLLATALVKVQAQSGFDITLRSLLDQGSQASFVTESAVQLLGLKKYSSKSTISGLGSDKSLTSRKIVYLKIQSLHDSSFIVSVKAHVLSKLTAVLPGEKTEIQLLPPMSELKLADPKYNIPNKIDILLGAYVYGQILLEGLIKGPVGSPVAQNTKFGWILSGIVQAEKISNIHVNHHILNMHSQVSEDELLRKFWEIESEPSLKNKRLLTEEEKTCETMFINTTKRDDSGRYIVKLPMHEDHRSQDGNSRIIAAKRFSTLEKRFIKNVDLKDKYGGVINEYIDMRHMEEVPSEERFKKDVVYLPHHAAIKEDRSTTRLEIKQAVIVCHTTQENSEILWTKYSSLTEQVRIIAWMKRFYKITRDRNVLPSYLTSKELAEALNVCIKYWQEQEFKDDIIKIKSKQQLSKKSKLTHLNPYLDEDGMLRVGGRLNSAALSEDRKHPLIIPARTHLTNLLISDAHVKTFHGGPKLMITLLRSRYWILDMKNQVKLFCRKCVTCVRYSSRTTEQLMGQLPAARVTPGRPFRKSGVDYAGPINIRTSVGRGYTYLTQFLNRYRWSHCVPEPKIGDIVLVKEDGLPPARWLYGIITEKHPGLDKITRVVSLRCKGVIIKRPVTKLCILPVTE